MSMLILPRRFSGQPRQGVTVDRTSPVAHGLHAGWLGSRRGFFGAARNIAHVATPREVFDPKFGVGIRRASGSGGFMDGVPGIGLGDITVMVVARPAVYTAGSTPTLITLGQAVNGSQLSINAGHIDGVTGNFQGKFSIGGTQYVGGSFPIDPARPVVVLAMRLEQGVEQALFVNGVKDPITSNVAPGAVLGRGFMGHYSGSATQETYAMYVWRRALLDLELTSLADDPYQMFESPRRKVWYVASTVRHTLVGGTSEQANKSTAGVVGQRHTMTVTGSHQAFTSTAGAVQQAQRIAAGGNEQANTSTAAPVAQRHALQGANSTQANTGSAGQTAQRHGLVGAASEQTNTSTTGAMGQVRHALVGANSQQANTTATGATVQRHLLAGTNVNQPNTANAGAVGQRYLLAALACGQDNRSSAGAVGVRHWVTVAATYQVNTASDGVIMCRHLLVSAPALQLNSSPSVRMPGVKFNVDLSRVWNAPAENRVHNAFAETRIYNGPVEYRVHTAFAEDRIARI